MANLSRIPPRGKRIKSILYRAIIRLEPLVKLGATGHIIVGKKKR